MHLSMLSSWGGWGRGISRGFELRLVFLFKCPALGKSPWVKKVQIPHSRSIIVGQKNSTNDQKSLPRADLWSQIPLLCPASPPPYPSGLTLIGALCVRNDRTKTSNRTPQLQIQIKGKEALWQIITSYLHTNLCIQPGYSPVNCVQLCFHCSRLFHGLLPHILTCLHEVCEIEPITLRRRHRLSAYPARL